MHAPKTDTPATQMPEQLPEHQARVSRDSTLGSHMCSCGFGYPGISHEEWMRHYVRELESTLAAERASRLQAEEALREALDDMRHEWSTHGGTRQMICQALAACESLAKPEDTGEPFTGMYAQDTDGFWVRKEKP